MPGISGSDNSVVRSGDILVPTYAYFPDKNVKKETQAAGTFEDLSFTATYDDGNRVASYNRQDSYPGARETQTWDYDGAGNWDSTTIDGTTQSRDHSDSDQLEQIGTANLSYDPRGNLLADERGNDYTWDLDNRITKAEGSGYTDIEYRYDALGRRIVREQGSQKEVLLWWGNTEQSEHKHQALQTTIQNDLQANPSEEALNTVFARALEGDKQDIQYFHKNYLDHVMAVSDDSGDLLEHYRYTAFGEPEIYDPTGDKLTATDIDNDILWNVRRYEPATGHYMYLYRGYDAAAGRWPSRDPIEEEGGVNLYCFVENEPAINTDFFGLSRKNVKRSIYIMGGPDTKNPHPALPATEGIFDTLNYYMFGNKVPDGYKYSRISEHDAPGNKTDGDPKLHKLTEEMLKFKNEWESANPDYECCVDYKGTYFTGKKGAPLTPTVILDILTNPKIKEYNRIMLAAHIGWMPNNDTGLFLGAGTAPAGPSSSQIVDWGGVVPWTRLFEGVPAMEVEIYTCFTHNVPKKAGNVTLNPKGESQDTSYWRDILPKHIKPWVESECEKNKDKK